MENNVKQIIAHNISELRKNKKWTQLELAEMVNYSDKAVSRWERGDTLPDIDILLKLCDLFGVDFQYLITNDPETQKEHVKQSKFQLGNKLVISLLAVSIVWFIATCVYVYSGILLEDKVWKIFIWAVPVSAFVGFIFNYKWGKSLYSIVLASLFIWSLLASFYIQFIEYNIWLIFLLGIPSQVVIILWGNLKRK